MRTAGATSFASVKLSELNRLLKPDADIPVSRRFQEMLKLHGKAMTADTPTIVALTNRTDFTVTTFDDEERPTKTEDKSEPIKGEEKVKLNVLDSFE